MEAYFCALFLVGSRHVYRVHFTLLLLSISPCSLILSLSKCRCQIYLIFFNFELKLAIHTRLEQHANLCPHLSPSMLLFGRSFQSDVDDREKMTLMCEKFKKGDYTITEADKVLVYFLLSLIRL